MAANCSVCGIVVTFNPDLTTLKMLLTSVACQVESIVIVDNGSNSYFTSYVDKQYQDKQVTLISLGENLGLAAGHNRGIEWAKEQGYPYVLLLDQDSIPSEKMVQKLLSAVHVLREKGEPIAAVGPKYIDRRISCDTPFVRFGIFTNTHLYCQYPCDSEYVCVDFLISSGTLIPISVINKIGAMDESLFIDNVDMEWCFRATSNSLKLYGVCDAEMYHSLGDRVFDIWFFRQRHIIVHSPTRLYYMMRNRILLYKKRYTPRNWIFQDFFRLIIKFFLFAFMVSPRLKNVSMMSVGLWHGIRGRTGRYEAKIRNRSPWASL